MGYWSFFGGAAVCAVVLGTPPASAHCDGLDGPVVSAARKALEAGNPNPVLIWVQSQDEAEVRRTFNETLAVRKRGPEARKMADRYFFEMLVRLHRAGEGVPYGGLKPAGRDLGPAIPLADRAVASGSNSQLAEFIANEVQQGLRKRFSELQSKQKFRASDIVAGRAYVASYVAFVHYVEHLHEAATSRAVGHYPEQKAPSTARDDEL